MKVIKAYSLDKKTVEMLEDYCVREEVAFGSNRKGLVSRSKLVNDAIKWFMQGDVAELVHGNEQLQKRFAEAMKKQDQQNPRARKRWWRDLLGF